MTKKYKLTEKYIIHNGVKLFQIQALGLNPRFDVAFLNFISL